MFSKESLMSRFAESNAATSSSRPKFPAKYATQRAARGASKQPIRYRVFDGSVSREKGTSAKQVWKAYREIEGFGLLASAWYLVQYATRTPLKSRRF
ncbi:hypothetical protein Q9K01_13135 [Qipengyuania sp. DY56-A-20]|uniref:Uncharacterized protein n=1 Tax=Qipengyuania benthica TaxID=3067651 RepID=A0ABT9HB88_9SPHN|nr:hypothetical protein [Qipengyuania sp. DY56-A-20]MDP4540570.1 hypothetical protein [Qipengyuania sp. DY56-A-20]